MSYGNTQHTCCGMTTGCPQGWNVLIDTHKLSFSIPVEAGDFIKGRHCVQTQAHRVVSCVTHSQEYCICSGQIVNTRSCTACRLQVLKGRKSLEIICVHIHWICSLN